MGCVQLPVVGIVICPGLCSGPARHCVKETGEDALPVAGLLLVQQRAPLLQGCEESRAGRLPDLHPARA